MSKHTPGPWIVDSYRASPPEVIAPGLHDICVMYGASSNSGVMADARLIAAAPELLEALESIRDCCDEDHAARDYASRQTEIRGIARAAIAKATGEEA